jgi:sulfopyruvate decarboxylase subunit beta
MMRRDECLRVLARHHTDEIVVPVYLACFDWIAIKPEAPNFIAIGAMGQAGPHALGLALGLPERRIIVLDGDGSLLMNLGTLVTIASAAPTNLLHFVCENGSYEANGGHPIPGRGVVSFAAMARAAGYREVHEFSDLAGFDAALPALLAAAGPVFATLKIEPGPPPAKDYAYMHGTEARERFRRHIAPQ